jgi:hypothetical protein
MSRRSKDRPDVDAILQGAIKAHKFDLTFEMILDVFRQHQVWPRIDRVQRKVFVRNLSRGFVSLSEDEAAAAKAVKNKWFDVVMAAKVFLVHYNGRRRLVEVYGPDAKTVTDAMSMVLKAVRAAN